MVYGYYSPIEGTILAFFPSKDSEQRAEIWTKRSAIPAASMVKAAEALALSAIWL